MAEEILKNGKVVCASCGGDLGQSSRIEGSGEDAEEVPVARCLSCGKEYDRYTEEYYKVFASMFTEGLETGAFKLGAKGEIDGVEYEIIGRIRYQDEDEWEVDVWDEWLAVTSDGTYHWFVEEGGEVYAYEEYVPTSMNLEESPHAIEFEGRRISKKSSGFVARIVYAEGELTWKPEIGEPMQCYDFSHKRFHYTIEQSEDEVSVTKGKRIPYRKVIMAFAREEYYEKYERTISKRSLYRKKARVYALFGIVSFVLAVHGCFSGNPISGAFDRASRIVLSANQMKSDEGGAAYFSQILYTKGVEFSRTDSLYQIHMEIDNNVQGLHLEWMSCRLMLIKEPKFRELMAQKEAAGGAEKNQGMGMPLKPDEVPTTALGDVLEDVDIYPEPIESFSMGGDFWDEEGYDDEGHWHESETLIVKDFIIDEPGVYYAYLEMYSQNIRNTDSVRITIMENLRSYRYYVLVFFIFVILGGINLVRSKTYNELPFPVAGE